MAGIYLISDLHLEPERRDITATLFRFLDTHAGHADALYILGDLFEVWVGDDAPNPLADELATRLRLLGDAGVSVYLMHGNRDFLIGRDYAANCGATLLTDPFVLDSPVGKIALLHGDTLCTRDTEYMRFRAMVRNPDWQRDFLGKSLVERQMIAQQARSRSQQATRGYASEIMDVTHQAVVDRLQELKVNTLIHGHTHRPAIHTIRLDHPVNKRGDARRIVLGDWHAKAWYGLIDSDGIRLEHLPLLTVDHQT
ncbi:MAG: UDP-2,3-diacylglucosamine diphosphatase [Pseudohongiellaceae bacterium]